MDYYLKDIDTSIEQLKSTKNGITQKEAEQRIAQNGKNKLDEAKNDPWIKRFFMQMADPMIIMLIVAAGISAITSAYEGHAFTDVFVILFVVLLNAFLGVIQESKAEKAIEALKEMTAATSKVLRDGEVVTIKSEDLVVGDVVLLEAGDAIPADGRIIESISLKAEEAALTGESVPVEKFIDALNLREGTKDVALGDRTNMLYMGSTIVYGRGKMIVTAIGMNTEMGKIAQALQQAVDGDTPLQKKLAELGKTLSKLVLVICAVVFAVTLWKTGDFGGKSILNTFMIAVALAVAAIPEGLPAVVTIVLSIGVTKMSKHNAVIRKLMAVETLGSTQIICSDKTGTLTQNKMSVTDCYGEDKELLAKAMTLCSDAEIKEDGTETGDPTEIALVAYGAKLGFNKAELTKTHPRIGEAPFDSNRKMMSTVHKTPGGKIIQYTKGAPDILLDKCDSYIKDGKVLPLDDNARNEILTHNKKFADNALRVLAAAYKDHEKEPASYDADALETSLTFIGLTGMIDPARPEVFEAIKKCRKAGIRPIMITGDHKDTAVAIATEIGIIHDPSEAISGTEIEEMTDEYLNNNIEKYAVYARVQPEHKVRIVKSWKTQGMITAMTGDGVNDAPSIKSADIGVGMGITGTDVTKNVADMVLADDNFATIVYAIEEGRKIYDNIRKVLLFLLSANLSEVVCVFAASVMGFTILEPAHLLFVNLVTDAAPALALGMEEAETDIMNRQPRPSDESIFAGFKSDIAFHGLYISIIVFASYFIGHFIESGLWEITTSADGMTMAFLTLSMAEIFHSFNMRSQRKSIFSLKYHNHYLYGSAVISLILTSIVTLIPSISAIFGFTHITLQEYAVSIALAFSIIPLVEITKAFQRLYFRKKGKA